MLLLARMQRVPQFAVALGALLAGALLLPATSPVILRSLEMNPWQALWGVTGALLTTSLRERHTSMEAALPRSPRLRRRLTAALTLSCAAAAVSASAALTHNPALAGLTTVAFSAALALGLACASGTWTATMATFTYALVNWIFGLADDGVSVRPWALLVRPASPWLALVALVAVIVASALWSQFGSADDID